MNWFKNLLPSRIRADGNKRKSIPEGLWDKCDSCKSILYRTELERGLEVCPKCQHHHHLTARRRLDIFLDPGKREEIASHLAPTDILNFRDSKKYKDRITAAQKSTGEKDALIVVRGELKKCPIVVAAFDFRFMGGSMGAIVGERFACAVDSCLEHKVPLVCFSSSGGARMQEALVSLMQMAKTSAVLQKMAEKQLPYISVMTNPTMGGVSASLAMLGDINIAEPNALIGFAGPRVIEQIVKEKLPEGFQRSEFLLKHGALDMIVHRQDMRDTIARLLSKLLKKPLN